MGRFVLCILITTAAVEHLVEEALHLSREARLELVEALLELSAPAQDFIEEQMKTVVSRMEDVQEGRSVLISADEAHRRVREALASA